MARRVWRGERRILRLHSACSRLRSKIGTRDESIIVAVVAAGSMQLHVVKVGSVRVRSVGQASGIYVCADHGETIFSTACAVASKSLVPTYSNACTLVLGLISTLRKLRSRRAIISSQSVSPSTGKSPPGFYVANTSHSKRKFRTWLPNINTYIICSFCHDPEGRSEEIVDETPTDPKSPTDAPREPSALPLYASLR